MLSSYIVLKLYKLKYLKCLPLLEHSKNFIKILNVICNRLVLLWTQYLSGSRENQFLVARAAQTMKITIIIYYSCPTMPLLALHLQANTVLVLQYFLGNPFRFWGKTNTKLLHFKFIIFKKS